MARRPLSGSKLEFSHGPTTYRKTTIVKFPSHLLIYRPLVEGGLRVIGVTHGARELRAFLRSRQ